MITAERSSGGGVRKDEPLYNLRPEWVSKWLDDIGLPQYKDQFYEARIDSRMLNFITVVSQILNSGQLYSTWQSGYSAAACLPLELRVRAKIVGFFIQ